MAPGRVLRMQPEVTLPRNQGDVLSYVYARILVTA